MGTTFWVILAVLIALYFYINRNRTQKQGYFRAVMASLGEKGMPSDQLLGKISPTESGKILLDCYNRKIPPSQAADVLLDKYNSLPPS